MVFTRPRSGWPVLQYTLQIFATDLNADAIAFAGEDATPPR